MSIKFRHKYRKFKDQGGTLIRDGISRKLSGQVKRNSGIKSLLKALTNKLSILITGLENEGLKKTPLTYVGKTDWENLQSYRVSSVFIGYFHLRMGRRSENLQ